MQDRTETRLRLRGLFNIAVTPFHADGSFDFTALEQNIERVIALGYDGLLIGGTYGEFPAMSAAERADLFCRVAAIVEDRVPLMLCTASSDTREIHDLTILASDLGGLPMITAPYVSEITDAQIVDFFHSIAPLSRTGILIYNAPGIGITLSPSVIEELSDIDGVVGIKQGDLTPAVIDRIANRLSGKIRLFCASDLAFQGSLMAGFDGLSSTNSCALPELILGAYRALEAGNAALSRDLQRLWYPLRALARQHGQPQIVKAAMNARGFGGGSVRPPLTDVGPAVMEAVTGVMQELERNSDSGLSLSQNAQGSCGT